MATGVLRPPKHVASLDDYQRVAEIINAKMSGDLVFAIWNEGGVCVIVKKGDTYRCASTIGESIAGGVSKPVFLSLRIHSDSINKMVYIK